MLKCILYLTLFMDVIGKLYNLGSMLKEGVQYTRELNDSISSSASSYAAGNAPLNEYSATAAIILAVSIVGITVAVTRYSKFSFLPRM